MSILADAKNLTLGTLVDFLRTAEDWKSTSLSQLGKRCNVSSRVYIQDRIADEPVTGDLLQTLHNLYIGYIFTALQINTYVSHNRTVRDMLGVVGTENYVGDKVIGIEDFASSINNVGMWDRSRNDWRDSDTEPGDVKGTGIRDFKDVRLPQGRIMDVTFYNQDSKQSVVVQLLVQLLPRILPTEVCDQIVQLNFTKDLSKRWLQYKAGEISFWKDFVFQFDLLKKYQTAMKKDHTGDLSDIMKQQKNSLFRQLLKVFRIFPEMQNIANSIMIFEEQAFQKSCNDAHMNFKRYADRQKFFSKSYGMIVATVDPMYSQVKLYINGIDAIGTYTFKQMASTSKTDKVSLADLMGAMSQGQTPRF